MSNSIVTNYLMRIRRKSIWILAIILKAHFTGKKKKDIILFGSRNGEYYMDNSRFLYEWYLKNQPQQKSYWMTRNLKIYNDLRTKGYPVARIDSFFGLTLVNQASFGVYTNRSLDLALKEKFLPKDIKLIYLSHGQGLKSTRLTIKSNISREFKEDIIATSTLVALATTTSRFMAKTQSEKLNIPLKKYKITGSPRNDCLFKGNEKLEQQWNCFIKNLDYKKVVLYAPTWRMYGIPTVFFPFNDFDLLELIKFLEEKKILLLLRPHIKDMEGNETCQFFLDKLVNSTSYIKFATQDVFGDSSNLLPFTDCLITDYSSIYLDYLILDRPIFFIPYDYIEFEKLNGFTIPYHENLPGTILSTQKQFIRELENFHLERDCYKDKRVEIRKRLFKYLDGNSCSRISVEIDKLKSNGDSTV